MVLQCCVETTNRTRCRRAYMRTLSHGGNTTRRGRFLPNEPNRRNALSVKELSVRAPSHTVLPSVVALIRPVRVSVIYFASPRITGVSFMPPCIFPAIYREAGLDERSDIRERWLRSCGLQSTQNSAAVDLNVLPGNEACARAAEKTHSPRNILRLTKAANKRADAPVMLGDRLACGSRPFDQTRCDRIDPDFVRRKLVRERAREAFKPGFGGHNVGATRGAGMRAQAADIDDGAAAGALELGQADWNAIERALEDDAGDRAPVRKRHLFERLLRAHRRVVDQDINAPEMRDRGSNHLCHCIGIGDIRSERDGGAACVGDLSGDSLGLAAVRARVDHHGRAALGERERNAASDIAARPGDEGDTSR